jgi:hypothetical protein
MSLEQILGQRYRVLSRLPAQTSTHQRYVLESGNGTGERFVLSFRDYSSPVSAPTLVLQELLAKALAHPPLPLFCRAIEWRMGNDFQYMISESPGTLTLRELLQSRQSLKAEETESVLRVLGDACEAAVQKGWPRLPLESVHLYWDSKLGGPRVPVPDIPGYDAAAPNMLAFDPMQTVQFNAAELNRSLDLPPKDTRDYVQPLAALCCDLLGQPQSVHGGNARYQPVPQLSSAQNVLLRRALTGEGRSGFAGAKAFIDELFGSRPSASADPYPDNLRTLTVTLSTTEANTLAPVAAGAITLNPATAVPATQPSPLPTAPATGNAPLRISAEELAAMEKAGPATRLRFVPEKEDAPVLALCAESQLIFGRSAVDADFVTQFRPRSSLNDARSRRISRAQGMARLEDGHIFFDEKETLNPTVHRDGSIHDGAAMDSPAYLLLAGEFPLEMHRVASDFTAAREVQEHGKWNDAVSPQGAMVVRPAGPGVLLWEAAMVLSDIGLHFSTSGRPWFRVEKDHPPALRVHHLAGHFWLEVLDEKVMHTPGHSARRQRHELVHLHDGLKLQLGNHTYTVQSVALKEAVAS